MEDAWPKYTCCRHRSNRVARLLFTELASHTKDQQVKLTEPAFILVPDALKADVERRYLSKFDVNGLMLAEVLSFERFAYRIFSRAGGLATDSISKIGKSLLIQKIICQRPEQFKRFQRFAARQVIVMN